MIQSSAVISSNGYAIRKLEEYDKAMVLSWRNHPEVRQVMLNDHEISEEEHDRWWQSLKHKTDIYLIVLKHDSPVAVVNFYNINAETRSAWWGFYINNAEVIQSSDRVALWIAIEALVIDYSKTQLKLCELLCESLAINEMVIALHKRYGFEICAKPVGSRETTKDVVYMRKTFSYPEEKAGVYFLCSYSTNVLVSDFEEYCLHYPVLNMTVHTLPFSQYQILLQDKEHDLNRSGNHLIFCERIEDFIANYELLNDSEVDRLSSSLDDYLSLLQSTARKNTGSSIYVFDFGIIKFSVQILQSSTTKIDELIVQKNNALKEIALAYDIKIISYANSVQDYGAYNAFSHKYWNLARIPFSKGFSSFLANKISATMLATRLLQARVLVLDLDNTLWKGIVGDDGFHGIQLGGDFPGNIYKSLQRLFKAYKDSGLLLCICSKNTEHVALEVINKHPEMLLRENDFIIKKINWKSKAENIKEIAQELNLGLSSICFIDDNPLERQEVRHHLPTVFVPELPIDPADWYSFIVNLPELTLPSVSEIDAKKTEQYQARALIQQEASLYDDKSTFIRSLQIKVKIRNTQDQDFSRVYQLFNKTNQFNTATIRYSQTELAQIMQSNQDKVYYVLVSDKYHSEHEGLAALVVKAVGQDTWLIENFVMSCRVMGRNIEIAIMAWLTEQAKHQAIEWLKGQYIRSDRNQPIADLYQRLGFALGDDGYWYKSVVDQKIEKLDIEVEGYPNV